VKSAYVGVLSITVYDVCLTKLPNDAFLRTYPCR